MLVEEGIDLAGKVRRVRHQAAERGILGQAAGVGRRMPLQVVHGGDNWGRRARIPYPPAGNRVALGKRIDQYRLMFERRKQLGQIPHKLVES